MLLHKTLLIQKWRLIVFNDLIAIREKISIILDFFLAEYVSQTFKFYCLNSKNIYSVRKKSKMAHKATIW